MVQVITRFAPSPTGILHIGNARTALINYLFSLKNNGKFILRIDDTDIVRSKKEFEQKIINDLKWLGFSWDEIYHQSARIEKYEKAKNYLIDTGRLYECYETPEELEIKRKIQLSSGNPPIYDRAALNLSQKQKDDYLNLGRKPHYRFLINRDKFIEWDDKIKGHIKYDPNNLSDPIVIREDSTMTYMICSTVDDIDLSISDVIRGEDHVSNTAIQIQMFEILGDKVPNFGHLSLVKSKDDKISKRIGGFEIETLRNFVGIEAMTINSFFAKIGTSQPVHPEKDLISLAQSFDISNFSKSPTTYLSEEMERLNHKYLSSISFNDIKKNLNDLGFTQVTEKFWNIVKNNLKYLKDLKIWSEICFNFKYIYDNNMLPDKEFIKISLDTFIFEEINEDTWKIWTEEISKLTNKKGKDLYKPLRIILTGNYEGPEMKFLLLIIGKEEIIKRINNALNAKG